MSCSAKGAASDEFDLGIPELVSGLVRLDALVFNDPIGIGFKTLVLLWAGECEFHLASRSIDLPR